MGFIDFTVVVLATILAVCHAAPMLDNQSSNPTPTNETNTPVELLAPYLRQSSNPTPTNISSHEDALGYLARFGYISADESSALLRDGIIISEKAPFKEALVKMQNFAGISATGKLDDATLALMNTKRCGMPDMHDSFTRGIDGNYTLLGTKWASTYVTYRVTRFTPDLPIPTVDSIFQRAAYQWDCASALYIYTICSGSVGDIEIGFYSRDHGDGAPFDGPSGVLAHAFQPAPAYTGYSALYGDAHFDDDELWTVGVPTGINLYQVATHELGHSLGLGHSSSSSAVMYPYYTGYNANFALDADDIYGIRALYGVP